ncbi:MAG: preprotein translocase subunit YajC [Deltaproteobacteria bacterium]|nr:preprotein translocase subunit YajC [Deltaproteobacteria bacterium]
MHPVPPTDLIQTLGQAAPSGAAGGGFGSSILLLVAILGIFYFLLIRPQQKQAKEHASLVAGLKKDDRVVTSSGLFGRIWAVKDTTVLLEVAKDVRVEVEKTSVKRKVAAASDSESSEIETDAKGRKR